MIPRVRPEARWSELLPTLLGGGRPEEIADFQDLLARELSLPARPQITPSGRAGLYYLFRALPQERVYLPAYTCWVVLEAAQLADKQVSLVEVAYPSFNMNPDALSATLDEPGIVVATHQFGFPEDIVAIRERIGNSGHYLVEDCAGALYTRRGSKPVGLLGDAALFSFEASKLWPLGGGGALLLRDNEYADRVAELMENECQRTSGLTAVLHQAQRRLLTQPFIYGLLLRLYLLQHEPTEGRGTPARQPGPEYTRAFGPAQATLGLRMANRIPEIVKRRRVLFRYYREALAQTRLFRNPPLLPDSDVCPIRIPILVAGVDKYAVYHYLRAQGIDLGFSFSYTLGETGRFPGAEALATECLNLPLGNGLSTSEARKIVIALKAADHHFSQ